MYIGLGQTRHIIKTQMGNTPRPLNQPLIFTTLTWLKESHQLFDYYCTEVEEKQHLVTGSGFLFRNENQVILGSHVAEHDEPILELQKSGNEDEGYDLTISECRRKNATQTADSLWIVVEHNKERELRLNDGIRMGRVEFRIRELSTRSTTRPSAFDSRTFYTEDNPKTELQIPLDHSRVSNTNPQCRICFSRDPSDQNPLIAPCNCKGSLEYIHLLCLREWLETKVVKKVYPMAFYYSWKNLKCEICSNEIADKYDYQGKSYDVFEFTKPTEPYIVLERTQVKEDGKKISVCITKLEEGRQTKLGRGEKAHVKINDISVSRHHSSLVLRKDKVYISDKSSKFGTLVKFTDPIKLTGAQDLWLQFGRTVIKFQSLKAQNGLCCCSGS